MFGEKGLRWILLGGGVALVAIAYLLALALGWPVGPKEWIDWVRSIDGKFVDPWVKAGGLVVSLMGGASTIYHAWHFADRHLPERLNEYLARNHLLQREDRQKFMLAVQSRTSAASEPINPQTNPADERLTGLLKQMFEPGLIDKSLLKQLQDKVKIGTDVVTATRHQIATAHLVVGLLARHQNTARILPNGAGDSRYNLERSVEADPQAFEAYPVLIEIVLEAGDYTVADVHIDTWKRAALEVGSGREVGRSEFWKAKHALIQADRLTNVTDRRAFFGQARDAAMMALKMFEGHGLDGTPVGRDREIADARLLLGKAKLGLNALFDAWASLAQARNIYETLGLQRQKLECQQLLAEIAVTQTTDGAQPPAIRFVQETIALSRTLEQIGRRAEAQSLVINAKLSFDRVSNGAVNSDMEAALKSSIDERLRDIAATNSSSNGQSPQSKAAP